MTVPTDPILNGDYWVYIIAIIPILFIQIEQDSIVHILGGAIKKNKPRLKWINFLKYDEKINGCILDLKKNGCGIF